jgi:hypothetical protein
MPSSALLCSAASILIRDVKYYTLFQAIWQILPVNRFYTVKQNSCPSERGELRLPRSDGQEFCFTALKSPVQLVGSI